MRTYPALRAGLFSVAPSALANGDFGIFGVRCERPLNRRNAKIESLKLKILAADERGLVNNSFVGRVPRCNSLNHYGCADTLGMLRLTLSPLRLRSGSLGFRSA